MDDIVYIIADGKGHANIVWTNNQERPDGSQLRNIDWFSLVEAGRERTCRREDAEFDLDPAWGDFEGAK